MSFPPCGGRLCNLSLRSFQHSSPSEPLARTVASRQQLPAPSGSRAIHTRTPTEIATTGPCHLRPFTALTAVNANPMSRVFDGVALPPSLYRSHRAAIALRRLRERHVVPPQRPHPRRLRRPPA